MISVKSRGNIIRYNTLRHDNQRVIEREISLRDAAETTVEGNFLFGTCIRVFGRDHVIRGNYIEGAFGNPERGIRLPLWGSGAYPSTENVLIEDNVVVGSYVSAIEIACGATHPVNLVGAVVIRNNVSQGDDGILYLECNPLGPVTYEGNTGWGNATLFSGMSGDGISVQDPHLTHDGGFWHLPSDNNPNRPMTPADVGPEWLGGPPQ
jgi:nitrous oxidase accessory protein NosD